MASLYHELCKSHGLFPDPAQKRVFQSLQKLRLILETHACRPKWRTWFSPPIKIKGLYIYGEVGRGKTMLMDFFFNSLSTQKKERIHFHIFMKKVHQRLKELRACNMGDPFMTIATEWKRAADLICFDEFHITDIADAMILSRLFDCLWKVGLVIVATSNFKPEALYAGGLHRERLNAFFEQLSNYMQVAHLSGEYDYRHEDRSNKRQYFYPLTVVTQKRLQEIYSKITYGQEETSLGFIVHGRKISVQRAHGGVCRVGFTQLCAQAYGRDEYLTLAQHYHTIVLENVPCFSQKDENIARRFITLIDILYDQKTNLIMSAADRPEKLYQGRVNKELFKRTVSRLVEMTGFVEDLPL